MPPTLSKDVDRLLLETLRSDAMQIRLCVLMALAQTAFSQASEGVRINAFRAASMYTGMAARMTQLLQENAAIVDSRFCRCHVAVSPSRQSPGCYWGFSFISANP